MGHNTYREEAHLLLRLLQEATDAVHAGVPKRVPYTFYVKRYGAIDFLVSRDLQNFLFVIHVDMKRSYQWVNCHHKKTTKLVFRELIVRQLCYIVK